MESYFEAVAEDVWAIIKQGKRVLVSEDVANKKPLIDTQKEILKALKGTTLTAKELAAKLGKPLQTVKENCAKLAKRGSIKNIPTRGYYDLNYPPAQ